MFTPMPPWSCVLFIPGSRVELLPKALATGAGRVCIDLEDAVAEAEKNEARAAVAALLEGEEPDGGREAAGASTAGGPHRLIVRINHPGTDHGARDLAAIRSLRRAPEGLSIMVPKVDHGGDVAVVRDGLGERADAFACGVVPVIETVHGLANVESVAGEEGVVALILGGLDLSVDLECSLDWEALLYARSRCVHAARLAGVDVVDTPFFDLEDEEGLRDEASRAWRMGFTAKAAIHPSQVDPIHEIFEPTPGEIAHARRVVAAVEGGARGVFRLDGRMVDRPAVQAARRMVARWDAGTPPRE